MLSRLLAYMCTLALLVSLSACDMPVSHASESESGLTTATADFNSVKTTKEKKSNKDKKDKFDAKYYTLDKCKEDCTINSVTITVNYTVEDNTTDSDGDGSADADIDAVTLICFIGDDGYIAPESCNVSN